jgi:hypothetical protein
MLTGSYHLRSAQRAKQVPEVVYSLVYPHPGRHTGRGRQVRCSGYER